MAQRKASAIRRRAIASPLARSPKAGMMGLPRTPPIGYFNRPPLIPTVLRRKVLVCFRVQDPSCAVSMDVSPICQRGSIAPLFTRKMP